MINTMASNIGTKPISGAYVVMLKRHLLRLQEQQLRTGKSSPVDISKEYPDQVIALERISPIIREIERLAGYASFGLDIGKLMHPSDYGIFGYAMMNCETLMCALRTACEHKNMLNREFNAEFISDNDLVVYKVNTALISKEIQILIELDFSSAFEFAQRLAGPHKDELKISSVHFTHPPLGPLEHYLMHFKCPVHFNSIENRIIIEKAVLDTPIYGANPKVLSVLEDKIGKMTRYAINTPNQLKHQVSRYVKEQLGGELSSAQAAAKNFNMSLSAFKKRLHLEGSCYQLICDEVRYRHCQELMQQDSLAMKEIAFELGFTNASAFNRAFKRWSGECPSFFKKRSHAEKEDCS
mgnify:CR=1 FL=1|tara:strand:- start:12262 stop:13320 length:1059 start_codon:yes stop_codon:yes gene_type:complete